jgi:two-component system sensor histidine kinase TctE
MSESEDVVRRPGGPFTSEASENAPTSLFLEILDWMLAPLLLLWPISIAFTNHYAHQLADQPYDGALVESVHVLGQYLEGLDTALPKRLPKSVQTTLTGNGDDARFYRVSAAPTLPQDPLVGTQAELSSELFVGHSQEKSRKLMSVPLTPYDIDTAEIALVDDFARAPSLAIRLRDDVVRGESVRVAYQVVAAGSGEKLLVQVAETRKRRELLSGDIIRAVLIPQFAMIPIAAILSFLGLSRGLRPLRRLRNLIIRRRPGDLSPLTTQRVPEEVRPVLLALNEMMARLETNLQTQQRFIADAAHQLRTPLTGLKMQAELALNESDPVRLRRSMQMIAESADRAAHLTNQLLMLARTETSHDKLHRFEPVDLRALTRAVTIEWADRAMAKDIDISFEGGDWPHMSEGVPLLLREMLSNLVDNAVKYTPRGGRVTVRVRSTEFVVLEVEDSGIGIPVEERSKVFERFYRVLGSDEIGSGLGLPIVQEIADLHRARIELLDGEQGGTLFRVSLVRRGGSFSPDELRPD